MNSWYKLREIINLMKLKINIWTVILAIVNSVVFASSWFVIFSTTFSNAANGGNVAYRVGIFFYVMAGIGVVLNIIAIIQSKRHGISIVGSVLELILVMLYFYSVVH